MWETKFWGRVDSRGDDACWPFMGTRDKAPYDYGRFRVGKRKERAHRLAWLLTFGEIPDGLHVCHHCDNPPCCNPAHLFLGTHRMNMRDAYRKGRLNPKPPPAPRGERSGAARLTEQQVREIRASTEPQRVLGMRYGVSGVAICKIRTRQTWAHVE